MCCGKHLIRLVLCLSLDHGGDFLSLDDVRYQLLTHLRSSSVSNHRTTKKAPLPLWRIAPTGRGYQTNVRWSVSIGPGHYLINSSTVYPRRNCAGGRCILGMGPSDARCPPERGRDFDRPILRERSTVAWPARRQSGSRPRTEADRTTEAAGCIALARRNTSVSKPTEMQ